LAGLRQVMSQRRPHPLTLKKPNKFLEESGF
jgi:hypothetical protein